jgi:hypothetical protein
MKKIYLIILAILLVPLTSSLAQTTTIFITNGTALVVPNGAEICADFITVEFGGSYVTADPSGTCAGATVTGGIEEETSTVPTEFALYQNYPNPFNPSTVIKYEVPENSFVTLKIFDLLGKELVTLVNEEKSAGSYDVKFNASQFASGFYIYTINAGDFTSTKKLLLMK